MTPDLPPAPAVDAGQPEPTAAAQLQARAVNGSLWTMLHVVVSVPIAFAANAVVARTLGVTDYGRLAFLTLALSIAVSASNLGVSDGVIQWGAAAQARGDNAMVDSLLRRSLGYHAFVQLPLLVLTVVLLAHRDGPLVMAALVISVALPALLGSAALAITIENRTAASAKLAMFTNLLTQLAVAGVAAATHLPAAVWAARSLTGAALLPLNFSLLDRSRRRVALQLRLPRDMPLGFWRFGLFTAAGGLIGLLVFSRSELLLLQGFGALKAAGLFALAFGVAQQVTAPVDALLNPLQPAVAGIVEAHPGRVPETLLRATRISSLLCAGVCTVGLPPLFALIPIIYGRNFSAAAPAFLALGIASCLQSAVNPLLTFTRARRRAGSLLMINCGALAVDVAVAVLAIPAFGLWGAILANVAGQVTVLGLLVRLECRAWSISPATYGRAIVTFIAAAAGAMLAVPLDRSGLPAPATVLAAMCSSGLAVVVITYLSGSRIPLADLRPALDILPQRVQPVITLILRPVTI